MYGCEPESLSLCRFPSPGLQFDDAEPLAKLPAQEATSAEDSNQAALLASLEAEEDMLAQLLLAEELHQEELRLAMLMSEMDLADNRAPAPTYQCHSTQLHMPRS